MTKRSEQGLKEIRTLFPILQTKVHDRPLVYLDNAATMQMPLPVMERMTEFYTKENANIHRGIHTLSETATEAYEKARGTAGIFLGVNDTNRIVFTSGTTDGINMAAGMLEEVLEQGDEIMTTEMEHHSDFLPWAELAERKGLMLRIVPVKTDGCLDLDWLFSHISNKTRVLAFTELSNVTGIRNPADEIIKKVRRLSERTFILVDGAQGAVHGREKFDALQCDFYCMSGHKIGAPSGTGVTCMSERVQKELRPVRFGGGTVRSVSREERIYYEPPACFEPGTPNYAGAVGMSAAMQFWMEQEEQCGGKNSLYAHESALLVEMEKELQMIPDLRLLGEAKEKERAGSLSFVVEGIHAYDICQFLDQYGIAARSGHHCAMPYLTALGCEYAVRFSVAPYNTLEEIRFAADACKKTCDMIRNVSAGKRR